MIEAKSYQTVYLIAVTILTFFLSNTYSAHPNKRLTQVRRNHTNIAGCVIALLFAIYIGFRPLSGRYFVDMINYHENYFAFFYGRTFNFNWDTQNIVFDNLFAWLGSNQYEITTFFVLMALGYFLIAFKAMTRFFQQDALYGFVVWLGAFSTFSYGTNGLKAGVAASIFLCAIAYRDKPMKAAILLVLSFGIHHSMMLPVGAYVACYIIKKPKYYIVFWFLALALSVLHVTTFQEYLAGTTDEHGAKYLNNTLGEWGGKTGFRYDFVLYSALPVFIGYYAIFKRKIQSVQYEFLYNVYLLTNGVWMLCMYASFTNRIAYLSWGLYPVVTMYPFFTTEFIPNQYKYANYVAWFQLLFTLAMTFIYYA